MLFKNSLLILFAFILTFSAFGQDQMERLYRSDRQNSALDIVQTSDDGYLILSAGRDLDSTDFDFYTITSLTDKGDILWSKDYQFEEKVNVSGTIHLLEEDSFLVYGSLLNMPKHHFLMKADPAGNVIWTKGYENDNVDNNTFTSKTQMDTSYQNGYIVGGVDVKPLNSTSESWVSELNADGELLWIKYYSNPDYSNLNIVNAQTTRDSGLIVCGSISDTPFDADICLIKTDSLGEILWSRKYGDTLEVEAATSIVQTPDDGFLIGGLDDNNLGILIKTDTLGEILWSANIDFEIFNTQPVIQQIIMASDGNAVIAGTLFGANDNFAFMIKINMAGDVVWKRKYRESTDDYQLNGLTQANTEGYVFVTTSEENGDQVGPHLIKTNITGEIMGCDTAIMEDLLVPITVEADTLLNVATADTLIAADVIVLDTLDYTGFNPPTLTLQSFQHCPDDIFSDTLDATVPGAIAYEWESGETTPTLVVTEFDTYSVTVTMGEDYCYKLCGVGIVSEKPLPEVTISVNQDPYCTQGFVNLTAISSNATSLEWSTTENSPVIQVMNEGDYSVTVTNECGEDSQDLDLMINMEPPSVDISSDGDFCTEGQETLSANIDGDVNSLLWSTNETTNTIVADQEGTYSITISTDFCGNNMASYDLIAPPPPTVSIIPSGDYCVEGQETLFAEASGLYNSLLWSTGDTTTSIIATLQNSYSVTVSADFCGENSAEYNLVPSPISISIDTVPGFCLEGETPMFVTGFNGPVTGYLWSTNETTDTIIASESGAYSVTLTSVYCGNATADIEISCPLKISIPNVFTPDNDGENDFFRPFYSVPSSDFVEYRFCVYSRWGEKVFETTNPDEAWDGTIEDELAVSDVYIWTLEGKTIYGKVIDKDVNGKEINSGDVTLLR